MSLDWPLMENNILAKDMEAVISFLRTSPVLTQSANVRLFEREWSDWIGVRFSVFVNSGSSANLLTLAALKYKHPSGEIILPPLTWPSDVIAVLKNGFRPVFADINPRTLCMDENRILARLTDNTRAVFMTHVQGFNGLSDPLLETLRQKKIPLIEDACEAIGTTHKGKKVGSFGLLSNFSFYYAHHLSTIEGGMICTDDEELYEILRMLRSHGMLREMDNTAWKESFQQKYPDLSADFIFLHPGFNVRNNEIGAILGRNQLKRLDGNNRKRTENFRLFLNCLDRERYRTDFELEGCSNYAINLVLRHKDDRLRDRVENMLRTNHVEFRRGSSGGGNQLRQPYLRGLVPENEWLRYPEVEHIHFYGYYIGNYPDLPESKIIDLCEKLNAL